MAGHESARRMLRPQRRHKRLRLTRKTRMHGHRSTAVPCWAGRRPLRSGMSAAAFPTMRWRRALAWLALVLSAAAHAQDPLPPPVGWPEVPERGASAADFAPAGWRVEHAIDGRLDGDDRADLLILLRMDDPANVLAHDGMGVSPFDSNPRMLVLALADGEGYRRVLADHRLIPRPYSPTADDVLGDGPGSALRIGDNR